MLKVQFHCPVRSATIDYIPNQFKLSNILNDDIAVKILAKIDNSTAAGIDAISGCYSKQIFDASVDNIDDEDEQELNIDELDIKLKQHNLMQNIENKIYHDILQQSSNNDKARILAYKSPKANIWLQMQIRHNVANRYTLSNEEFDFITRQHFIY